MVSDLCLRDLELQGLMGAGSYIYKLPGALEQSVFRNTGLSYCLGRATLKFGTGLEVNYVGRLFMSMPRIQQFLPLI